MLSGTSLPQSEEEGRGKPSPSVLTKEYGKLVGLIRTFRGRSQDLLNVSKVPSPEAYSRRSSITI